MPSCECPSPPGGTVDCPEGHIPTCIVVDGKPYGKCFRGPRKKSKSSLSDYFSKALRPVIIEAMGPVEARDYYSELNAGVRLLVEDQGFETSDGRIKITLTW